MLDLKDSIQTLNDIRERMKEATKEFDDVKNGDSTPEEEQQEPDFIIYDAIIDSTIEILKSEAVLNTFRKISETLPADVSKSLINAMAVCMSNSAYHAIVTYDTMLKRELNAQFDNYGLSLNNWIAVANAQDGAIKVLRRDIKLLQDEIEELKDHNRREM